MFLSYYMCFDVSSALHSYQYPFDGAGDSVHATDVVLSIVSTLSPRLVRADKRVGASSIVESAIHILRICSFLSVSSFSSFSKMNHSAENPIVSRYLGYAATTATTTTTLLSFWYIPRMAVVCSKQD
jgi:hypothetical protein